MSRPCNFQPPYHLSPYHTSSVIHEDDIKTTNTRVHIRFNSHDVKRSAELTLNQKNQLLKAANQIAAPYATVLTAKDRQRQIDIRTKWGMKHLKTLGDHRPHTLPPRGSVPGVTSTATQASPHK